MECKWRKDRAHIGDLDSLRSRLERVSPDVVGLLVSMEGFTDEVLTSVREKRDRLIVLISGPELQAATDQWRESLPQLLATKRDALLREARVLLNEKAKPRQSRHKSIYPQPARRYLRADGTGAPWFESGGEFGLFAYTHQLDDIDWNPRSGSGVALDFQIHVYGQRGLVRVFDTLVEHGWATGDASWSIQQSHCNWYGVGQASLLDALTLWQQRAAHHSEEFVYIDHCEMGYYTITANISASPERQVSYLEISFQLEGVPLDCKPLLHLCQTLGQHERLRFRPLNEKSLTRHWFRGGDRSN